MNEDVKEKIVNALLGSDYHISATGFRGVGKNELYEIIKIIRSNGNYEFKKELNALYKYHPSTINLDEELKKDSCPEFNPGCDCFYPDIDFEHCWCSRQRKEKIETTDKRNFPEYQEWRRKVFKRDDYTCQHCDAKGGELNAHHVKGYSKYPKLRLNKDNGITLCEKCHKAAHGNGD